MKAAEECIYDLFAQPFGYDIKLGLLVVNDIRIVNESCGKLLCMFA
jgi:hypothetical protein